MDSTASADPELVRPHERPQDRGEGMCVVWGLGSMLCGSFSNSPRSTKSLDNDGLKSYDARTPSFKRRTKSQDFGSTGDDLKARLLGVSEELFPSCGLLIPASFCSCASIPATVDVK